MFNTFICATDGSEAAGRALPCAKSLADQEGAALVVAVDTAELVEATRARDHALFAGKLDKDRLGFAERAIMVALRASEGDYRDWDEIHRWASDIADVVHAEK